MPRPAPGGAAGELKQVVLDWSGHCTSWLSMEVAERLDVLFADMLSLDIEVATRHYAAQSDAA